MPDASGRYRAAVVGAGLIAQNAHLPQLMQRDDVIISAIVDSDTDRAANVAEKFSISAVTDFDSILADPLIDVVDLCTPPAGHADQLRAAISAGKHVIMEKPVATTLADVDSLIEAVSNSQRTVMIAENWIYSSAATEIYDLVQNGALGEVYLWTSRHESDHRLPSGGQPDWNYSLEKAGGGYLMQAGTHPVSLGRRLFGEVQSVMAISPQAKGGGVLYSTAGGAFLDEDMGILLQFHSGVQGVMALTSRSRRSADRILQQSLFGTAGTADLDILTGEIRISPEKAVFTSPTGRPFSMGYAEEFGHFFDCVREGSQPITSVVDQASTIRTITAIYESARSGSRVFVGDIK